MLQNRQTKQLYCIINHRFAVIYYKIHFKN